MWHAEKMIERWIRGPWWDCCWVLSGPVIGVGLVAGNVPISDLLWPFVALNSGHLLAPIAMAWGHRGFRRVMLVNRRKFIFTPVAIVIMGGIAGAAVGKSLPINPITLSVRVDDLADYARPLVVLLVVYFVWNAYHFAMQNYGLLRFYWAALDRAAAMQLAMFGTLLGMIIIPIKFHQPQLSLFLLGLIIINHQLVAIGLAGHVLGNHWRRSPLWFAGALLAAGVVLVWLMLDAAAHVAMVVVGLRVTAGFVHFLYDRWVWKLGNPQVRATIGAELFREAHRKQSASAVAVRIGDGGLR